VAVYREGRKVVDLWGGYRDARDRSPWERDTLVPVFSITKGMASIAMLVAHSRGWIDFEQPVAIYWPEFAQAGKAATTVRQLLDHQAGLPAIDEPLTLEILADPERLDPILAGQAPAWEPGTRHGYHGVTLGLYEGALLRRIDPEGRSLGEFFADEVGSPLGLEFHIGLPATISSQRLAHIEGFGPKDWVRNLRHWPVGLVAKLFNPRSLPARSFRNPEALVDMRNYNDRAILEIEIPGSNGVGEVRSIARAFGELATGGEALGLRPETLRLVEASPRLPPRGARDALLHTDLAYALGYIKPHGDRPLRAGGLRFGVAGDRAYATAGAGGSLALADPGIGLGMAYAPNRLLPRLRNDPRSSAIYDAIERTIEA
jgi:CubicO group peptidase (beta-lactamase class C family)